MPPRSRVSLQLLLVVMDLLGGFSIMVGSDALHGAGVPFALFWLLLPSGCTGVLVATLRDSINLREPWDRVLEIAGALPCLALGFEVLPHHPESLVIGALAIAAIYWRGLILGSDTTALERIQGHFGLGFAAVFFGVVWAVARGATGDSGLWQTLAVVGIGYTGVAMLALALARMERESSAIASIAIALALELGMLVLLGVAALAFFSYDVGGWIGHATQPFWNLVGAGVGAVLHVVLYPLLWVNDHLRSHRRPVPLKSPLQQLIPRQRVGAESHASSPGIWATILGGVLAALILSGVALLLWRVMPRRRKRRSDEPREAMGTDAQTPLPVWQAFLGWLRGLFRRGSDTAAERLGSAGRRIRGPMYPADPVRRLYAQLQYRAGAHGVPRSESTTPLEFQQHLAGRWPTGGREFAIITEAYMRRRYGEMVPDGREVEELRQIWHRLRSLMREPAELA